MIEKMVVIVVAAGVNLQYSYGLCRVHRGAPPLPCIFRIYGGCLMKKIRERENLVDAVVCSDALRGLGESFHPGE